MSLLNKDNPVYKIYHPIVYRLMRLQELKEKKNYISTKYSSKIRTLHNSSLEKVCFLIGNGPSLKVDDLNRIEELGLHSFAANRIYGVYDQTKWRPTYFVCQDDRIMEQILGDMEYIVSQSTKTFLAMNRLDIGSLKDLDKVYPYFVLWHPQKESLPEFANDISEGICEGQTVIYSMAQIAIYMGYKKMYIIGVDNSFSKSTRDSDSDKYNYFQGVKAIDNSKLYDAKPTESEAAFNELLKVSKASKFEIYNATRGGKLEVFERVNLDEVFDEIARSRV